MRATLRYSHALMSGRKNQIGNSKVREEEEDACHVEVLARVDVRRGPVALGRVDLFVRSKGRPLLISSY